MARARNIKPGFFTNEQVADLPPLVRIVFIGLWTIADFKGCLEWRPRRIKTYVLPYDDYDLDQAANEMQEAGLIRRYEIDGQHYIKILGFVKHQNPHKQERDAGSDIPDVPMPQPTQNQQVDALPNNIGSEPEVNVPLPDSLNPQPDSRFPRTDTRESGIQPADEWDAMDAHTLGYPLADLFKFFPRLTLSSGQMGMIQAEVKDTPTDRAAWSATIEQYVGNHDPATKSYLPQKVGNLLSVFKAKRQDLEKQNGSSKNGNRKRTDEDVLTESIDFYESNFS